MNGSGRAPAHSRGLLNSAAGVRVPPPCLLETRLSALAASLSHPWRHRALIRILARRELVARYRGSLLGSMWTFVTPLLMLLVFTLVFGVVLSARWPGAAGEGGIGMFALAMMAGLLLHSQIGRAHV